MAHETRDVSRCVACDQIKCLPADVDRAACQGLRSQQPAVLASLRGRITKMSKIHLSCSL
jgi:hypothetical protein